MADNQSRIDQFRFMSEANPNDELAFFSLGRALLEANQPQEAATAFSRVLEINPNMSRAYQLLAEAQTTAGQGELAVATLTAGARVANERGDLVPRNEMVKLLKERGIELPDLAPPEPPAMATEGQVQCSRCGQIKPKMARPPFSHAQGIAIQGKVCAECWQEWIRMGTKVINELRLPLNDPQAQKVYDQHMNEFLNLQ